MRWILAYDIADPRRLKRVAQQLERFAQRVQKSVFLFDGSHRTLTAALDRVAAEIDPEHDRLQAWPLAAARSEHDFGNETALPPLARAVVIVAGEILSVPSSTTS